MAGEYDINLSNGTILATLHPLEVNGPDNTSTPRQIQEIVGSPAAFVLVGDLTGRFVSGFQFEVQKSGGLVGSPPAYANDGTYTVAVGGSTYDSINDVTTIPVTSTIPSTTLPLGQVLYTNPDSRTTLSLPGRGTVNYGEYLIDNFVHLLENFAADEPPENNPYLGDPTGSPPVSALYGQPLTGQWWYNTTAGQEGFKYFDGSAWTSTLDIDDGALVFRDVEDGNKDIYLTASETNLPAPWVVGSPTNNQPGFVIWQESDPSSGEAILRVLSSDATEHLRVEYDGSLSTTNNIEVLAQASGSNASFIDGTLAIGGRSDGTTNRAITDRTLTVQGDGITVYTDPAKNATLDLDAPSGMYAEILFQYHNTSGSPISSSLLGDISALDTAPNPALRLNATASTDVVMVTGGGNVGINQASPSATLDVVGTSEFNGTTVFNSPVGINNAAPSGSPVWLEVTGDIQANSQFRGSDQSEANPTYSFTSDTTTGMYYDGTDLAFAVGGVKQLTVSSSTLDLTKGFVTGGTDMTASQTGAGIISAGDSGRTLTSGTLTLESGTVPTLYFYGPDNYTGAGIRFGTGTDPVAASFIYNHQSNAMSFSVEGPSFTNPALWIEADGNALENLHRIGINHNAPSHMLHIAATNTYAADANICLEGASNNDSMIYFGNSTNPELWGLGRDQNGQHLQLLYNDTSEVLRVTTSEELWIGTTTAVAAGTYKMHVAGGAAFDGDVVFNDSVVLSGIPQMPTTAKAGLSALGAGNATEPVGSVVFVTDDAGSPTFIMAWVDSTSTWVRSDTGTAIS